MAELGHGVLVVDDEEGIRRGLARLFTRAGYRVHTTAHPSEAIEILKEHEHDVAIVDIRLRDGQNGLELLKKIKATDPELTVIMITGYGSIETAVHSIRAGAADYILKPVENDQLLDVVQKNLELRVLRSENRFLKKELRSNLYSTEFLTQDPDLQQIVKIADRIKNTDVTILLTGESGTGKDILAQYIHFTSDRKDHNFVTINCATLNEDLLLSELFGHERGSFTGAIARKLGKFEVADGGTLFLDEVAEMSINVQAKLLRVLEESSFERVGGNRSIRVNVRVIAASNKNLTERIKEAQFREDLYYRLRVINFQLPPLRERPEDIALLTKHFLRYYGRRYTKPVLDVSSDLMKWMIGYSWPGNVRELKNAINQAVLLSDGPTISSLSQQGISDTDADPFNSGPLTSGPVEKFAPPLTQGETLSNRMDAVTRRYESVLISDTLKSNGGNKSATARELGITRKTLRDKMNRYNID